MTGGGAHRRDNSPAPWALTVMVILYVALGVTAGILRIWWVVIYCGLTLALVWAFASALREIRRDQQ